MFLFLFFIFLAHQDKAIPVILVRDLALWTVLFFIQLLPRCIALPMFTWTVTSYFGSSTLFSVLFPLSNYTENIILLLFHIGAGVMLKLML